MLILQPCGVTGVLLLPKKAMRNFYDNDETPSIFDVAMAYENGNGGIIKPRTHVVVNTNRLWYGSGSTVSAFLATAYDEKGKKVDSMEGYFWNRLQTMIGQR